MGYGDPRGDTKLRDVIASHLNQVRGLAIRRQNVLVTRGSQMAIALAALVVAGPGDSIAMEHPGYAPAPTGVAMSACRRTGLLDLALERRFAIIEDDYDYEFIFGTRPPLALASVDAGRSVLYVGSEGRRPLAHPGPRVVPRFPKDADRRPRRTSRGTSNGVVRQGSCPCTGFVADSRAASPIATSG